MQRPDRGAAEDGLAPAASTGASVRGRVVVVAGATSASGLAAVRALRGAGARPVAVGRSRQKLDDLASAAPGVITEVCDLGDEAAVIGLADRVHNTVGAVHGVLHLVGGWRGGGGLAGQTDEDYRFLERSLTALRAVSRVFDSDLRVSDAARQAIVSSTAVDHPTAGSANYVAIKAASETWMRAVAHGFAKAARDDGAPVRAASVIFRVTALAEHEQTLADAFVALWDADAATVNGSVTTLGEP